jgi:hypothetical protein
MSSTDIPADEEEIVRQFHLITSLDRQGPLARRYEETLGAGRFRQACLGVARARSIREFSASRRITAEEARDAFQACFLMDVLGHCTVPSAGNLQTVRAVLVTSEGEVMPVTSSLDYSPGPVDRADYSRAIFGQCGGRHCCLALFANPQACVGKYGARAYRYLHIEAGHIIHEAMGIAQRRGWAGCPLGAFDDTFFSRVATYPDDPILPLYLYAVGWPA